jgi:signal transduction histidine kinase
MTLPKLKALPLAPTAWILFLFTTAILGAIMARVTLQTREALRADLLSRDAQTIALLAEMEMEQLLLDFPEWQGPAFREFALSEVLVNTSRYEGVLGVALYSTEGRLVESIPLGFPQSRPATELLTTALFESPASRYFQDAQLSDFLDTSEATGNSPLLAVAIPLARDPANLPEGVGYYLLDGSRVQAAFAALDRELTTQALGPLAGGALLLGIILGLAFRYLAISQKRLAQRSQALAQANRELSLALKSDALGSLSAQLLHDLKSPLFSLLGYVEDQKAEAADSASREMAEEAHTTLNRMMNNIQEVVDTLQDAGLDDDSIEFTWGEFSEMLQARLTEARLKGLNLQIASPPKGELDGNQANILLLILFNLIHNAWEASEPESPIILDFAQRPDSTQITIKDNGPGLSPAALDRLFKPQRSSKPGGSGLGLALSHQLARRIGASLELQSSTTDGTCFAVSLSSQVTKEAKSRPLPSTI